MKKAFLFGGKNNGTTIMVDDHQKIVNMIVDREISYTSDQSELFVAEMTCATEIYIKSDLIYREKAGERSYNQMELFVFFHERTPQSIIDSVKSITDMALNAKWERVVIW